MSCYWAKNPRIKPNCLLCGGTCKARKSKYCSTGCFQNANPMAGNQRAVRENPTKWAHYKRMQKMCPPGPCVKCGSLLNSVIHHKDHDHTNTVPGNLERLCRKHHIEEHRGDLRHAA